MNKVYCPWCRHEMELEHYRIEDDEFFAYVCPDCAAQTPTLYSAETALAAALARPLQKPLTTEESKKQVSVWIEYSEKVKFGESIEPALYVCSDDSESCFDDGFSEQFCLEDKDYGKMWRCWATKPTDEERGAAKWE